MNSSRLAITYNIGGYRPNKGLKQGHFYGQKFYGEKINDFRAVLRTIAASGETVAPVPTQTGQAPVGPPVSPSAKGPAFWAHPQTTSLSLRNEPVISVPPTKNVIAELPDGWPVRALSNEVVTGFREIEVVLSGTVFKGFSSADYLVAKVGTAPIPLVGGGVVPTVWMPRKAGTVTRHLQNANAHSLNEAAMPDRSGSPPDELRSDLHAIIAYLDPVNRAKKNAMRRVRA